MIEKLNSTGYWNSSPFNWSVKGNCYKVALNRFFYSASSLVPSEDLRRPYCQTKSFMYFNLINPCKEFRFSNLWGINHNSICTWSDPWQQILFGELYEHSTQLVFKINATSSEQSLNFTICSVIVCISQSSAGFGRPILLFWVRQSPISPQG